MAVFIWSLARLSDSRRSVFVSPRVHTHMSREERESLLSSLADMSLEGRTEPVRRLNTFHGKQAAYAERLGRRRKLSKRLAFQHPKVA